MITAAAKKALVKRDRAVRAWRAAMARQDGALLDRITGLPALLARLQAEPADTWPDHIAPEASWLAASDADTRAAILALISRRMSAAMAREGREFLDDPLPPELGGPAEPTPWQRIATLFTSPRPARGATPQRRTPVITLNLSGPADVPVAISTLEALLASLRGNASPNTAPVGSGETVGAAAADDAPKARRPRKSPDASAATERATQEEAQEDEGKSAPDAASAPGPAASGAPAPSTPQVDLTLEKVREHLSKYAEAAGPVALGKLLGEFGVRRISEVPAERWGDVIARAVL